MNSCVARTDTAGMPYGPVPEEIVVDQDVLDRARAGDERAFHELTAPYRRELHVHCYRMLGSFADAEDVLQDTLLAAWRGLGGFAGRASLRTWLYRIATNRCLNALRDAGRRRPPEPTPPFDPPEPTRRGDLTWLQPYPDALLDELAAPAPGPEARYTAQEAIELAFVAALQRIPPRQAAALVLRDVLGYPTAEAAEMLGTSPAAIKAAVQRARERLRQDAIDPERVTPPGSPGERALARRFAEAFAAGDIDGVTALLTDDAWLAMPPAPHEYQGPDIAAFLTALTAWLGSRGPRLVPTRANGRPAYGCYFARPGESLARPAGVLVLAPEGDRIQAVTWFVDPSLAGRFGLPEAVPVPDAAPG